MMTLFHPFQFFLLILFYIIPSSSFSQTYTPGVASFDETGYVEYIPGNLPVILSAPHGGYLTPAEIPDRDCLGCSYLRDSYTQELARTIADDFFEATGCYPHVVINLLHRRKFDANRDIGEAADGNSTIEQAWQAYHDFLDDAKAQIIEEDGRGLFLDLHGHAHDIQRVELGYLLSKSELQLTDETLNTNNYIEESSLRTLVDDNLQHLSHAELLRGAHSLGTLLENKGVRAVPSAPDPFPNDNESYFSGGYNTNRHGSKHGGNIDGIQIECHQDIRFDDDLRAMFADSLTKSINQYIDFHYQDNYIGNYCQEVLAVQDIDFRLNYNKILHVVHLVWQAEGDDNDENFIVEYAKDGSSFKKIMEITSVENATFTQTYQATHTLTEHDGGKLYYRLKQVERNGDEAYSPVISIDIPKMTLTQVYPTFVLKGEVINMMNEDGLEFELYDAYGRLLIYHSKKEHTTAKTIATEALPTGVYWIKTKWKTVLVTII